MIDIVSKKPLSFQSSVTYTMPCLTAWRGTRNRILLRPFRTSPPVEEVALEDAAHNLGHLGPAGSDKPEYGRNLPAIHREGGVAHHFARGEILNAEDLVAIASRLPHVSLTIVQL